MTKVEQRRWIWSVVFTCQQDGMAEYGEWNRKGATLGDATAQTEYGATRDFKEAIGLN